MKGDVFERVQNRDGYWYSLTVPVLMIFIDLYVISPIENLLRCNFSCSTWLLLLMCDLFAMAKFLVMLATSIIVSIKQWYGVCLSICPIVKLFSWPVYIVRFSQGFCQRADTPVFFIIKGLAYKFCARSCDSLVGLLLFTSCETFCRCERRRTRQWHLQISRMHWHHWPRCQQQTAVRHQR